MNKWRLFWGVLCMMIAAGLTVANLVLPPESLMFQVGERNMPWIPPIIAAVLGIFFLATMFRPVVKEVVPPTDPAKEAANKRLETIAWGAFLIMLGGFMFVPQSSVKEGWWSIGVGLIFLGLNAARYFNHLRMSGFTVFLGILSIGGGIAALMGVEGIETAVLLIVLGSYLVLKPYFERRQLFGKAEKA